jgi:hypothetical protein
MANRNLTATLTRHTPSTLEIDKTLRAFSSNVKSQGGEDGILDYLFTSWWPPQSSDNRYIVEIGAWSSLLFSFCLIFQQI